MIQVVFCSNGVTAVFRDGEQVPELQVPWMRLFCEHLDAMGIDPRDVKFSMPDRRLAKVFLTSEDEYNWTVNRSPHGQVVV